MDVIFIQEIDFQKVRKLIREVKSKNQQIIFSSPGTSEQDDELNRKVLEKEKVEILLINLSKRKDSMKQRNSGFNQVLAKLTKKSNTVIGINLAELENSKSQKERMEIIARIRQNIILCSKDKLKMKFISKGKVQTNHDLKALGLTLGMPTWMTKEL